jgi:hypothetical protein
MESAVSRIRAVAVLALQIAIPVVFAGCSHQPREFDISPQAADERLPAPEAAAADLSGTWEFDPRASDRQGPGYGGEGGRMGRRGGFGVEGRNGRPGTDVPPATGGDYPGSAGMPPTAGRPGGRSSGGRGAPPGERRGGYDSTLAAPRRLVLAQTDSTLTIRRPGGATTTLYFDGRTVYVPDAMGDAQTEVNGRWHRKRFEVRRDLADGRAVTETYELSKDGTTLTVRSRMRVSEGSSSSSTEIRRVYRRVVDGGLDEAPEHRSPAPRD